MAIHTPQCDEQMRATTMRCAEGATTALQSSLAEKPDDQTIETDVRSLRNLSGVIGELLTEVDRCGGTHCMGRALDGRKFWVTQDRFDIERARADRYRGVIQGILKVVSADAGRYDLLVDWQNIVRTVQTLAESADSPTTSEFLARNYC